MVKERLENSLGKALREHRKNLGLRQADLAKRTRLSVPTIGALEQSKGNLSTWNKVISKLKLVLRGRNLPSASSIGESIRLLRKRRRISGRSVAKSIGVSHPTWVALEKRSEGRLSTLNAALVFLGAAPVLVPAGSRVKFYAHAATSSGHHAWRSPKWLLEILYKVFGTFDLDPCSPGENRRKSSVRAKVYYTAKDDGLSLPWHGKVFLNPPYGRELQAWTAKARSEVAVGNAKMVCALIPARTDTAWWHRDIVGQATVLFLKGRLCFDDSGQSAPFPSALILWGAGESELHRIAEAMPSAWNPHSVLTSANTSTSMGGIKRAGRPKKTRPGAF